MKQFLSTVFFLLISTALMAQNTATVTQTGNTNDAGVTQTGTNTGEVDQQGDENDATVTQSGANTWADVWQFGNLNTGTVTQTGSNEGWVDQLNGDENTGTVTQDGSGNTADLVQGMIEDYYAAFYGDPKAGISFTNPMISNNNTGSITQDGNDNLTQLLQVGDLNTGNISTTGDNNEAYAYQGWAGDWWGFGGVLAELYSDNSTVTIDQIGNSNKGAVWQYGGDNNSASISQDGDLNSSSISQGFIYDDANYDFTYPVYNTVDNTASVDQAGNDNIGKVFQLGDGNSFSLTQSGDGNTVGGRGLSGLEDVRNGYFAQDGDDNEFVGVQNDGATLDDGSFQFGDFNDIDLLQGAGDVSLIQQSGDWNTANVHQYGGGQDATVIQNGNSNTSNVTQQN